MERKIIELSLPEEEGKHVYVYEKNGLTERKRLDLDEKDFDEYEYDIIIPEIIFGVSSFYIDGLFGDSVINIIDITTFFDKYHIIGGDSVEDSFNKEINFLYNANFYINMRKAKEEKESGLPIPENCKEEDLKSPTDSDFKAITIAIYIFFSAYCAYWTGLYTEYYIMSLI